VKITLAAAAAFLMLSSTGARAAVLEDVKSRLTPMREHPNDPAQMLRADFLGARAQLRGWIDTQLATFKYNGDTAAFEKSLNGQIAAADLTCIDVKPPGYDRCVSPGERDARGYLGAIEVARVRGFLIVQSQIGVSCGFDETAYVYEWVKDGWRLLIDTSRKPDSNGVFVPEQIQQVQFGQPDKLPKDEIVLLATSASLACAPPPRQVHFRVWSAKQGVGSALLIDGREGNAVIGRRDPAVSARFEGSDVLVEMDVMSLDPKRGRRVVVQRFAITEQTPRRIAPFALTPRDFVEEWLRAPWSVASAWTQTAARAALERIHADINAGELRASFPNPTSRCEKEDGVVQVAVRLPNGERFFRIKHDPAGAYEMRGADSTSSPACRTPDAGLDAARTLF